MNHKYIDTNTFEIVDNIIEVDEDIAETISILNKKGYYTNFCCSGHIKDPRLYEMYHRKNEIEYDDIDLGYIVNKDEDSFDILMPYTFTSTYVMFKENYYFNKLPAYFYVVNESKVNNYTIEKIIEYYDGGIRKSLSEIDKEIKDTNNVLLEWAKELPNLNK